jgi:hypothetical protein
MPARCRDRRTLKPPHEAEAEAESETRQGAGAPKKISAARSFLFRFGGAAGTFALARQKKIDGR